jgi:hypothetical protein
LGALACTQANFQSTEPVDHLDAAPESLSLKAGGKGLCD